MLNKLAINLDLAENASPLHHVKMAFFNDYSIAK